MRLMLTNSTLSGSESAFKTGMSPSFFVPGYSCIPVLFQVYSLQLPLFAASLKQPNQSVRAEKPLLVDLHFTGIADALYDVPPLRQKENYGSSQDP